MAKNWYGKMWQRNPLLTFLLTAGAATGVYFGAKKLFAPPPPPVLPFFDFPEGGGGIPQVGTTIDPKTGKPKKVLWSPVPLAKELFDSMDGIDPTSDKERAWQKLSSLPTRDMVIAVYNTFNKIPDVVENAAEYGTLTQWIRDEYGSVDDSYKDLALNKLEQLGLP